MIGPITSLRGVALWGPSGSTELLNNDHHLLAQFRYRDTSDLAVVAGGRTNVG